MKIKVAITQMSCSDNYEQNIKKAEVFERVSETEWRCRNCGYVHKGKTPPTECPACAHPQSYFELIARNW